MDDRSRKWENRRRLEKEGDEILELLGKHERMRRKRNGRKRRKKDGQDGRRNGRERAEERWTKWEDRQRLEIHDELLI